jgi:predicted RNA-binding Zn-ribbon protein involved in translation (DUF1610 family)
MTESNNTHEDSRGASDTTPEIDLEALFDESEEDAGDEDWSEDPGEEAESYYDSSFFKPMQSRKAWVILVLILVVIAVAVLYVYQAGDTKTILGNQPIPTGQSNLVAQPAGVTVPVAGGAMNLPVGGGLIETPMGVRGIQENLQVVPHGHATRSIAVQCPSCGTGGIPVCSACGSAMRPLNPGADIFVCPSCGTVGVPICPRCGGQMTAP